MKWACKQCRVVLPVTEAMFPLTCGKCGTRHEFPQGVIAGKAMLRTAASRPPSPTPPDYGPGTEITTIFREAGAKSDQCGGVCKAWQDQMNAWGVVGCREHRQEIIDRIKQAAFKSWLTDQLNAGWVSASIARQPWFVVSDPCGSIVSESIRRATVDILTCHQKTASGMAIAASTTAEALVAAGMSAKAIACDSEADIGVAVDRCGARCVVINGVWANVPKLIELAQSHPGTMILACCHSQVAFLQVDPTGTARCRDICRAKIPNLKLAGNSRRFTDWASAAWGCDVAYLPNVLKLGPMDIGGFRGLGPLSIGSLGALRHQKHHLVSAAAAMLIARKLQRPTQFYFNAPRKFDSAVIQDSILRLLDGDEWVTAKPVEWQSHGKVRSIISNLDLMLQPSASETFNRVVAEAAECGVPSVVGSAIDWVPSDWVANIDDPTEVAEVAVRLLADETAGERGREALRGHCEAAIGAWKLAVV